MTPHPQRCETCENNKCPAKQAGLEDPYHCAWDWIGCVGCASYSSTPAPASLCDDCNIIEVETKLADLEQDLKDARQHNPLLDLNDPITKMIWVNASGVHDAQVAKAERERVLEQLGDLNKYSCEEYEEASLSDNEREMRIHLEYGNRTWGIIRSLRDGATEEGGERR